jgi:hypothetical protein
MVFDGGIVSCSRSIAKYCDDKMQRQWDSKMVGRRIK